MTDTADSTTAPTDATACMQRGASLHAAGQLPDALQAFEQALASNPESLEAVTACASVWIDLGMPGTAWALMLLHRERFWQSAGGATNFAIVAETIGADDEARHGYERALALDARSPRALNNLALLAARQSLWSEAIARATDCVATAPGEPVAHITRIDILAQAGQFDEATRHLAATERQFGTGPHIVLRRAALLARQGQLGAAAQMMQPLGSAGTQALASMIAPHRPHSYLGLHEQLQALFLQHCEASQAECDWRVLPALQTVLDALANRPDLRRNPTDARDLLRVARPLLRDGALSHALRASTAQALAPQGRAIAGAPPPSAWRPADPRTRIGVLLPAGAARSPATHRLAGWLAGLDAARFHATGYGTGEPVTGIAWVALDHLSPLETVGRLRLDRLDILIDATQASAASMEVLLHARVARVQLPLPGSLARPVPPYDAVIGDSTTHPTPLPGVIVMSQSCWPGAIVTGAGTARPVAHRPAGPMLMVTAEPWQIDPHSFSLWMQVLHARPDAVLWLPDHSDAMRARLQQEAAARGIGTDRLSFFAVADAKAHLAQADLWLDTVHANDTGGLVWALAAGTAALTLAGPDVASRTSASVLAETGQVQGIATSDEGFTAAALALLASPHAASSSPSPHQADVAHRRTAAWEALFATLAAS